MYDLPKNFLMTYNPDNLEQHTDSSDFEDPCSSPDNSRHRNISLRKTKDRRSKEEKNYINQQISARNVYHNGVNCRRSKEQWNSETVTQRRTEIDLQVKQTYQNFKTALDCGNQAGSIQRKRSTIRHKLIPCISAMFHRPSINFKPMTIIKENQAELQTDNGCHDRCVTCGRKSTAFYKKQDCYSLHPIYATKNCTHGAPIPRGQTKMTQSPSYKTAKNHYSQHNVPYSQTSLVEEQEILPPRKSKRKKRSYDSDIVKERSKQYRNHKQQYLLNQEWKPPYQVFTNPHRHHSNDVGCNTQTDNKIDGIMPSSSSSFWEHVLEKFSKRTPRQRSEKSKCSYQHHPESHCCPDICEYSVAKVDQELRQQFYPAQDELCDCGQLPNNPGINGWQEPLSPTKKQTTAHVKCTCHKRNFLPKAGGPPRLPPDFPGNPPTLPPMSQPKPPPNSVPPCRACQHPHDELTQALAQRYNGEILCVHNPPCILINGCLNMPPPSNEPPMDVWPVMQENSSFQYNQMKSMKASQFPSPCYEIRQCQVPERNSEKIIQSICNHNPPCEVVRKCYKPQYDPALHNSCIHVPMCEKIPECMIEKKKLNRSVKSCEHKPKCVEIPVCTRNYVVLTAKEEVGIQARPKLKMVCRHEPPCIMIPKCLGRVMCDSYVPYDAIPGCVHRPMCDMIPACCRKSAKEMVSVCSQYPNSCRIS